MKITKKKNSVAAATQVENKPVVESSAAMNEAAGYIQNAIDSLGTIVLSSSDKAKEAKDAIANLGVILLDIRG